MGMSWGWHCADDHQENGWIFRYEDLANLVDLPRVWPCWDQFRHTASLITNPVLSGDTDGDSSWEDFLADHWNHRLLIMNEHGDLYPIDKGEHRKYQGHDDTITCECRCKPRATIHTHEKEEA